MPDETPHYLRFVRAIALVGAVTAAGCSSTATGQDVPSADQPTDATEDRTVTIDAGISVAPDAPPPGIVVAPDAPDVTDATDAGPPSPDAGIVVSPDAGTMFTPDGPSPGIVVAPDAETPSTDGGVIFRPDGPLPGVVVAPDAPTFGALDRASDDGRLA